MEGLHDNGIPFARKPSAELVTPERIKVGPQDTDLFVHHRSDMVGDIVLGKVEGSLHDGCCRRMTCRQMLRQRPESVRHGKRGHRAGRGAKLFVDFGPNAILLVRFLNQFSHALEVVLGTGSAFQERNHFLTKLTGDVFEILIFVPVARVKSKAGDVFKIVGPLEGLMQHDLSVARFHHADKGIGLRMQAIFHRPHRIAHKRADLVVKRELIAFFGVGIISELQVEHQVHDRVVVLDTHAGKDLLSVAVPGANERLMILRGIKNAFVVFTHEVNQRNLNGILLLCG